MKRRQIRPRTLFRPTVTATHTFSEVTQNIKTSTIEVAYILDHSHYSLLFANSLPVGLDIGPILSTRVVADAKDESEIFGTYCV